MASALLLTTGGRLMTSYEVQGRQTVREGGKVRNRVQLATCETSSEAYGLADAMAADRLTVWVFQTEQRSGGRTYKLLRVVPTSS
jgi:hypothetical protein